MAFAVGQANNLDTFFKDIYADNIERATPANVKLWNSLKFREAEKTGNQFILPVVLTFSHGVTYAAAGDGAYALKNGVPAEKAQAKVDGSNLTLREYIGYEDAEKAVKGKKAFVNNVGYLVKNMKESGDRRFEIMAFHGGAAAGLGTVASISTATITFTAGQWAAGIWAGMKGAPLTIAASDGTSAVEVTIASVSIKNKTITVSSGTGIAASDVIHFSGARGKEFKGLTAIITESSSLYGINPSTYELFKGNEVVLSGDISLGKIAAGLNEAIGKGLMEDLDVYLNPITWELVNDDLAALRRFERGGEGDLGSKSISYNYQGGEMKIHASSFVKEGEIFAIPPKRYRKVGATDGLIFNTPGMEGEKFFRHLADNNGYELRAWGQCAIFTDAPALSSRMTGFTNA